MTVGRQGQAKLPQELSLNELFSKVENQISIAMIEVNSDCRITRFNPAAAALFGYAKSVILNKPIALLIPERFPDEHKINTFKQILQMQQHSLKAKLLGQHRSGLPIPIELRVIQYQRHGQAMNMLLIENLADIDSMRAQHRQQTQRFKAVSDLAPVGILQTNERWEAIYVNNRWCEISRQQEASVLGLGWIGSLHRDDVTQTLDKLREAVNSRVEFSAQCRMYSPTEGVIRVELLAKPLLNAAGKADGFLATLADCTHRHNAEEKLRLFTERDQLTNLANRSLFLDRLNQALHKTNRHGPLALLCLDLDGFKNINDSLGHEAGDLLLQIVAQRLQTCVRAEDTVARLGGDEFSILLEIAQTATIAADIALKILSVLNQPIILLNQEVFITTSIGIALSDDQNPAENGKSLLKQADIALYRAKAMGRNTFTYFSPDLEVASRHRLTIGNSLYRALERQEFDVFYQLQATMDGKTIVGAEALLRWRHPKHGLLLPKEFLDILEDTGLIIAVNQWVWTKVFRQYRLWLDQGLMAASGHISINISPRQLRDATLPKVLLHKIKEAGLNPHQVLIEITENALIEDSPQITQILDQLWTAGVQIALDDFGTGFSSLTYLKRFPIHFLKIDQSFIRDLLTDKDDAAITFAVVNLAHSLNLTVIAEGVDHHEKRNQLALWGCDQFQGYILNRPGDSASVEKLLIAYLPA